MKYIYTLITSLLIVLQTTYGQQNPRLVNIAFSNVTIGKAIIDLQAQTNYHFYYDEAKLDTTKITAQGSDLTLSVALNMVFKTTDYHYTIVNQQVFISKGNHVIEPDLITNITPAKVDTKTNAPLDYTDNSNQPVAKATLENKVYDIGIKSNLVAAGRSILNGYIYNIKTGEPLTGINIGRDDININVTTDRFGYYAITLPRGLNVLTIRGIGMKTTRRQIMLYTDGKLNIELQEQVMSLKEVTINAKAINNVKRVEMGVEKLDIKSIKQVPTAFGESDVLRVVLTLPGVQSVGESSTGLNVRGGSADQNLILLNDATIYNPSHFFGFFSAFDPDIVKDVELYKASIPERFGGRLSSVLNVTNREGNKKTYTGSAGIGLITSRLNIEGPIIKDKTSFIFGGRTTYANWLLGLLPKEYKNSRASFYDLNFDVSHQVNEKNNIYLSVYASNDNFRLNSDTTYGYSNKNISLKWKHVFNNKLFGLFTSGFDKYEYNIASSAIPVNAYKLNFDINQAYLKTDFTYYLSPKHTINFGASSLHYLLHPGTYTPNDPKSLIVPNTVPAEQALESALYAGDHFDINPDFSVNFGIRYSMYNYLGPATVRNYPTGLPKTTVNLLDSVNYPAGKNIKTYHGPEYRISTRYNLSDDFSVKASYNTLRQYINLLSNTAAIAPTDVWKLSDPNIKPQYGDQLSLGLYKNLKSNTIELSVEVYYKHLHDFLDFKSGANIILNHHVETDVIETQGKAYGIEFLLKKSVGKLNGWVSYTYSRTFLQANDPTQGDIINNGNYYPANFDKPHAFNFIGNFRVSHRFNASLNVTYSTGRPITLPVAKYYAVGAERVIYSDRNAYRIPDYFRTDLSMNIDGNHKIHQRFHNSWSIGIYNLTARQNPFSVYYVTKGGTVSGYQLSIFGAAIPFINYNIRF
ncbi:MAG: carboxypeptidase-like regulatory domain-containing protein [Mucilaginibacter sp.]